MEFDIPIARHCDQRETSIDTSMNGRVTRFVVEYPSFPIFVALFIFFLLIKRQRMRRRISYRFLDCIRFSISSHPCEKACWFVKHHMTDWTLFFNPIHLTQYLSVWVPCIILPMNALNGRGSFSSNDELIIQRNKTKVNDGITRYTKTDRNPLLSSSYTWWSKVWWALVLLCRRKSDVDVMNQSLRCLVYNENRDVDWTL
jgi:hypothetical protein